MNTLSLNEHAMRCWQSMLIGRLHLLAGSALMLFASLFSSAVMAGQYGVQVVDDTGKPVAGASVCLGLPGNYSQFAAMFTGNDGIARAEVPNLPFVVTVSKTRFRGIRVSEPARGFNVIRRITLSGGIPGPRCRAGSTLAALDDSVVRIRNVAVDALSSGRKVLTPDAEGRPTEYRISNSELFREVSWSTLQGAITLPASLASSEQVYLQLRRYQGSFRGWVEARSKPVAVYLQ